MLIPLYRLHGGIRSAGHPVVAGRSWAEFAARVGGVAARLAGVERVVLDCDDSWDFAIRLLGALAAGAEVVLPTHAARVGDGLRLDGDFAAEPGEWMRPASPAARLVFQTSGSTGAPKSVVRSLAQLDAELAAIQARWGGEVTQGAPTLTTVPHRHVYGLAFALLWPLAVGRPFPARPRILWEDVLAALEPGAVLVTSPAHLGRMDGLAPLAEAARPALVLSAGAPLPEAHAALARRVLGISVTEIYGSTETGALAGRVRDGSDSAWRALPGYEVTRTQDGLLRLDSPAATAEIADRIQWAEGGGFRLLGRADRVAKIEGNRVALDAVEHALAALAQVEGAAVLVLDEAAPVLAAAVVLSETGRVELARLGAFRLGRALRAALSEDLEPAARPRRWRFVDALPEAGLGKRSAVGLAALFGAAAPRRPVLLAERRPDIHCVELDLCPPDDLLWFRGHFPGHPILPGVVQMDWALDLARRHLGLELAAARTFRIKFKAVIRPGDRLTLRLRHDAARKRLVFAYGRGVEECSAGTVFLP